jgi:riboflavin synthase
MFTGIVQGTGTVLSINDGETIRTLVIDLPNVENLAIGASVAINGVCLTATTIESNRVHFDVIEETLQRTSTGELDVGCTVNIERSLAFGDEIGGHLLSGHIMGTGLVHAVDASGEGMNLEILVPEELRKFILEKGYIGIDGISLTVGAVQNGCFSLHIIPETLRLTTLGQREVGDAVNLEIDSTTQTIVETVERYLSQQKGA